jgi:hypothetical protein
MEDLVDMHVVINEAVAAAELGDEAVLLNTETGIYFGLDPVAARIWTLLAEGMTREQIVHQILAEYDVTIEEIRADLARFVAELETHGLILQTAVPAVS